MQGNPRTITDARGIATQVQRYDLLGRPGWVGSADEGYGGSPDGGETWALLDVAGQPVRTWRSGGLAIERVYDELRRPVEVWVTEDGASPATKLVEYRVYGEFPDGSPSVVDALALNLLGRLYRVYDTAGVVQNDEFDFKGNLLSSTRQVFEDIEAEPDWQGIEQETDLGGIGDWVDTNGGLDEETFTVESTFDALNRLTSQTSPDGSVVDFFYNEASLLESVELSPAGSSSPPTPIVADIGYNARGQRTKIEYGNGTTTDYTYDDERFRLTRLLTTREADSPDAVLQDLQYTYDPVGNILGITDDAHEDVFFDNQQVTADRTFSYDALYRLVEATGREKTGLTQTTYLDPDMGGIPDSGNPALRTYTQTYTYDETGNITQMHHVPSSGSNWTRNYSYSTASNQLEATSHPLYPSYSDETYTYNERGAMVTMPHLEGLTRDFRDQIRQADINTSGDEAWYAYDSAGQRVRKLTKLGQNHHERIYVGPFEVYRKRVSGTLTDEIETLHIMDGEKRVCMVETVTLSSGSPPLSDDPRYRYQYGDHLGTVALECDEDGAVITYEEYHPFGTTAWWAAKSGIEVSQKRYRYTGMEKDEATGLCYHGARYYMPWLGRWERADPIGLQGGINRHAYVSGNPLGRTDPTGTQEVPGPPVPPTDNKDPIQPVEGARVTGLSLVTSGKGTPTLTAQEAAREGISIDRETHRKRGLLREGAQARLSLEVSFDVEGVTEDPITGQPAIGFERTVRLTEAVIAGESRTELGRGDRPGVVKLNEVTKDPPLNEQAEKAATEFLPDEGRFVVTDAPGFRRGTAPRRDAPIAVEETFTVSLRSDDLDIATSLEGDIIAEIQYTVRIEVEKRFLGRRVSAEILPESVRGQVTSPSGGLRPASDEELRVRL